MCLLYFWPGRVALLLFGTNGGVVRSQYSAGILFTPKYVLITKCRSCSIATIAVAVAYVDCILAAQHFCVLAVRCMFAVFLAG